MSTSPIRLFVGLAVLTAAAIATAEERELIWADEFNEDGPPDPAVWSFERGFVRNDEDQYYRPENARCEGGLLVIEARRENVPNARHDPDSNDWRRRRARGEYTSALLKTEGKFSWRYGVLEVRARIDARTGLWPAIWTLGEGPWWPACGEVDLMEFYRGDLLANACWSPGPDEVRRGPRRTVWDSSHTPLADLGDKSWSEAFHVWRMDWTAERITLSVDDRVLNTIDLDEVPVGPGGAHPFRQPHYLLLNLAIGGANGGDPSETEFPARFEVDYARVYQRSEDRSAEVARE